METSLANYYKYQKVLLHETILLIFHANLLLIDEEKTFCPNFLQKRVPEAS